MHTDPRRLSTLAQRLATTPDLTPGGAEVMVRLDHAARTGYDAGNQAAWVPAWVRRTQLLRAVLDEVEPEPCIRCGEPFDPASSRDGITCPDCRTADGLLP